MTADTVDRKSSHLASPALLRKIDELREKNIGQHVALPQVGCAMFITVISYSMIICF